MIASGRKRYIDVLKGIGIFLVVFGHVTHIPALREYIWGFHMPLFFFISGLLYNSEKYLSFRKFFTAKLKSIYIPYVLFFLLTFSYWLLIERKFRGGEFSVSHQLVGLFYGTYEGGHLNFNLALWFLPCLFSVEIIFYFVAKVKETIGIVILLLLSAIIAVLLYNYNLCVLPLGLHTAFFAVPFFGLGYLSKNLAEKMINTSFSYRVFLMIVCLSIQLLCLGVYSGTIQIAKLPYIPLALIGVTFYFTLAVQISSTKIVEYFGMNSIVVLAFHVQVYRALIYLISKVFASEPEIIRTNVIYSLLVSFITLLMLVPIIYAWNKYVRPKINILNFNN